MKKRSQAHEKEQLRQRQEHVESSGSTGDLAHHDRQNGKEAKVTGAQ